MKTGVQLANASVEDDSWKRLGNGKTISIPRIARSRNLIAKLSLLLVSGLFIQPVYAQNSKKMHAIKPSLEIVREFLLVVRSGKDPNRASEYLAHLVLAHQVNAENPVTVTRTPQNYADHVGEFLKLYGPFDFQITELIGQGDKVYARWKQTGRHLAQIDGYLPTGLPLVEVASAVYRLENGKIVEYWIQIDRLGFERQLQHNAKQNN
jgi:predicted ester cyclase